MYLFFMEERGVTDGDERREERQVGRRGETGEDRIMHMFF
jgi:hypothetical protein